MQRLHEDDLVGRVLEQENWEVVSFPAIAEQDEEHLIQTPFGSKRFTRRDRELLHPERESRETLDRIRKTVGEYDFASQYQQAPAPLGGGMVKEEWFKIYGPNEKPDTFDAIVQSWDTANKAAERNDYSVCTTWGLRAKQIYLLDVLRRRMEYPDLKRAVVQQARFYGAKFVLIEDSVSGTQLIQDLRREGLSGLKPRKAVGDKVMRLSAQTALIEAGFVYLPREAGWRAEYLRELAMFPNGKNDDQVDSTSQALAWINELRSESGHLVYMRREALSQFLAQGVSLEQIAERMRKTPEQIQEWIDEIPPGWSKRSPRG
jgi:predicted phage terminase large subunit-like protein